MGSTPTADTLPKGCIIELGRFGWWDLTAPDLWGLVWNWSSSDMYASPLALMILCCGVVWCGVVVRRLAKLAAKMWS